MPINGRLAREQCEKAFAAYLLNVKSNPPSWSDPTPLSRPEDVGVFIRKGQFNERGEYELERPDDIPLPSVCIAVPRIKPHEIMGYPICELHVIIMNGTDEDDASNRASARFGFVAELFDDSHQVDLFAALNKPTVGPDPRAVQNFRIFGMYLTEDMGRETGRHWIDHAVFDCHCLPTDDSDGDGQD